MSGLRSSSLPSIASFREAVGHGLSAAKVPMPRALAKLTLATLSPVRRQNGWLARTLAP